MDEQKHIINESTLAAYFNGELPQPEQKEVEAWIGQSEENRKIARDIYTQKNSDTSLFELLN